MMMSLMSTAMKTKGKRILGIDPGLARCGWAVVAPGGQSAELLAADCITTPAKQPESQRLARLYGQLQTVIARWHPEAMAIEELFFSRNVSTAMAVGQARGVALLAAAQTGIPVREFSPTTVKQTVTGYGRADKRQVETMIKLFLRIKTMPKHDDTVDAIAVALCGLHQPTWATSRS